ncbi:UDP-glucose/GDP-mannose dehydrogenase family protein [Acinetobacter cumulans]|uniref:UDP-glucose 6-dehydrogenase n=1 Tax=Acinetobacter cumulans TaxID=2136182 RepID=A0A3A8FQ28_9GAMM|nr:nucleotide sugar dehydrogenase [Acinetobacter cumulans]RKG48349.1 UDP-glucose/GDP-mannose dehydrogenase family protein [Acinetobacter cumulans]
MKIAIFGHTLYAMSMAGILSECGHEVICPQYFNTHQDSQCFLYDEAVVRLLETQQQKGFLQFCSLAELPIDIQVYLFSFGHSEEQQAIDILLELQKRPIIHPKLMLNASTLGLHGTDKLQQYLAQDDWVYLPDTVQEGNAIASLTNISQQVIGCDNPKVQPVICELFRPIFPRKEQFLFMPVLDAEFTKFSISGMLATRISYMNDMAVVAEKLGIDIENVRQGMSADNRIGRAYLNPGAGFGGENFSHDVLSLAQTVMDTGLKSQLLTQVWDINEQQKELLFRKLWNYFQGDLSGKVVAIWGASFKENTSRIEQSPIHAMLQALWAQGVQVRLHDPQALKEIQLQYGERADLVLCSTQYEAVQGVHALCVLTAWKQYMSPDYQRLFNLMSHPLLLDGRNIYSPEFIQSQGFAYMGVGR